MNIFYTDGKATASFLYLTKIVQSSVMCKLQLRFNIFRMFFRTTIRGDVFIVISPSDELSICGFNPKKAVIVYGKQ